MPARWRVRSRHALDGDIRPGPEERRDSARGAMGACGPTSGQRLARPQDETKVWAGAEAG